MKVKVGDNVRIIAGKDKGKEAKVIKTLSAANKVVVEGVNIVKKHSKPRYTTESGQIVEVEAPIHVSNVKVVEKTAKKEVKKEAKVVEAKAKKTTKATKKTKEGE